MSRSTARSLAIGVVVLHAMLLLTLELTGPWDPPRVPLFELLWASARRPSIQLAVLVLLVTPVCTAMAWSIRGRHRWWLAASWCVLIAVLLLRFARRLEVIWNVLWWRYS